MSIRPSVRLNVGYSFIPVSTDCSLRQANVGNSVRTIELKKNKKKKKKEKKENGLCVH